ncbi:MAG: toxin-antitoxin system HicB family antitoxin [Dehalococcoides mccartyi]|uniref:toxin-antitoxin system HicB family antitoxin n=1 Tax=Dehalococcoides TaxID=61434 RepID=UPI0027378EEB|nr:toxin-antitoxin system HicB family antitoxin [Dehalococcoides mccartyi]MDP4280435.1 toxin-antitoxin system HicB family antitoxin [Dehalococcoides mccartyi]
MSTKDGKENKERMIHVRLPESMHKKVRISAAESDQTIQDWVFEAIKNKLENQTKRRNF